MTKGTVYLAGPIAGMTDTECIDWREEAKSRLLASGYLVRNPMDRDYRGHENTFTAELAAEIVEGDKADIDASTHLLVWHPGPSTGTDMEICYAWEFGVRVFVVSPPGARVSPWLVYHSEAIFETLDQALRHLGA